MNHNYFRGMAIAAALLSFGALQAQDSTPDAGEEQQYYRGDIWRISSEEEAETLALIEENGGRVLNHRDDLYLVVYPVDAADELIGTRVLRRSRGLKRARRRFPAPKAVPAMDVARTFFGADEIAKGGGGLPQPFDGSGVVVGFSDIGFDATHPNFLNADGTECRVRKFVNYNISANLREEYSDSESIAAYRSDDAENTHATHVAGILTGRGAPSPYIGIAPGADIVATTSDLTDVGFLAGVEDIIAYAKSVDKPAVINLSLGSYNGPHDGTSLVCQYLDKCAEDAIICISAGNTGEKFGHIAYDFKSDDDRLHFRFYDENWAYVNILGQTDVYSSDDTPVSVSIIIQDTAKSGFPVVFQTPMIDFSETPEYILTSDPELAASDPVFHYSKEYADLFTGEIYLEGGIDPENGRYCVSVYCDTHTDILVSETKKWGRYQVGAYAQSKAGAHIDLYSDCQYSSFKSSGVTVKPDTDRSISNISTGHKVISVGAYWTRENVTCLDRSSWTGGTPQSVGKFSSYGTLDDGRVAPMTVAPGGPIVSSYSSTYVEKHGTANCVWTQDGYYWGADTGTSMAAPYVAGAIATWLQADPTLTSEEVIEVIKATNHSEEFPLGADPRHGQGYFDPLAGLKMVVENGYSSVQTIAGRSLFAAFDGNALNISNPDCRQLRVEVYSVAGRLLATVTPGSDMRVTLGREALGISGAHGVGICRVSAPGATSECVKIAY